MEGWFLFIERKKVAKNTKTPVHILDKLAGEVAKNTKTPVHILENLFTEL